MRIATELALKTVQANMRLSSDLLSNAAMDTTISGQDCALIMQMMKQTAASTIIIENLLNPVDEFIPTPKEM